MHTQQIIGSHPDVRGKTNEALIACIESCLDCAQSCAACADACIAEEQVAMLRQCIRLDLDCQDVCIATAALAGRRTGGNEPLLRSMLDLCAEACRLCAEECERHADMHEHFRICAEACRECESACDDAAATIPAQRRQ